MAHKTKKLLRFWKSFMGTIIDKGAKEEIERIERRYNIHRFKGREKR
jgi:hypothetical protein